MGYRPFRVTIGGVSIEGQTHGYMPDGLYIDWNTGVQGWFGTPDIKTKLTERELGDGSFSVDDGSVTYSSRTVAIGVMAAGRTSDDVAALRRKLLALSHRIVRISVLDGDEETCSEGYMSVEWGQVRRTKAQTGTLTVVCPDPRRYSTQAHVAYLRPSASSDMGLVYSSSGVLQLPLAYGGETAAGAGTATIANGGTATAYPVITLHGNIGHVSIRDVAGTGTLAYRGSASASAPVVLDCMSRTATVNGVDVTRNLVQRTWPSIPAGGSITLSCTGQGDGYIEVVSHDTYI